MRLPSARRLTRLLLVGVLARQAASAWLIRLLVDGRDASFWTVHHRFTLQVYGASPQHDDVRVVEGEECGSPTGHTDALEGALAVGRAPEVSVLDWRPGVTIWSWEGLRVVRGGNYTACLCARPGGCHTSALFTALGPRELLDERGRPFVRGSPYMLESFSLQVSGVELEPSSKIRVVGDSVQCGGEGSGAHAPALAGPLAAPPGSALLSSSLEETYPSLAWPALHIRRAGSFHVCYCSGARSTDAGQRPPPDLSVFVLPPPAPRDDVIDLDDNASENLSNMTWNGTNDTNDSNVSENVSFDNFTNASENASDNFSLPNTTTNVTLGDAPNLTLNESIALPEAPLDICVGPEMFDVEAGAFLVAGPTGLTARDSGGYYPEVGGNFTLTVHGHALGNGSQRVRIVPDAVLCGGPGAANSTEALEGALADDPDLPGSGSDLSAAQSWGPLRIAKQGEYTVCWCSGRGGSCETDQDFNIRVYHLSIWWPRLELRDEAGESLRALVNVTFTLQLVGHGLSAADQVRIVDIDTACGGASAHLSTPALRGDLGSPEAREGAAGPKLSWPGLRLLSGGMRRICWCPRGRRAGADAGGCTRGSDFYVEAGVFATLLLRHTWVDKCARARRPFRVHVAGIGVRPEVDRILLARASDVCGEALNNDGVLSPGSLIAHTHLEVDTGFASLRCAQDPIAGATLGERKLVCGDRAGTVLVASPGIYKVCFCGATPRYDCSNPAHYWAPAGEPFEVAAPATSGPEWEERNQVGGAAPPPMILNGPSPVLDVAYAPRDLSENATAERRLLAAACEDGVIRLWDPGAPRMTAELVGHTGRITALAWAPDGSWLVSGGTDGTVRLWREAAGIGPGASQAHICPQWEPAWYRPDGNATDEWWQNVIFGHLLDLLPSNVSEEPRAYRYAQQREDILPIDDLDDLVVVNELTLRRAARQCEKACVAYREMAVGMCECGPRLECHQLHTCVPKCGLEAYVWQPAHELGVSAVAVSASGDLIATASMDTTVKLWDVHAPSQTPLAVLRAHARGVRALAFSPAGIGSGGAVMLASGGDDATVKWHNVTSHLTGANTTRTLWQLKDALGLAVPILAVAFSADGRWFAAAGAQGGALWDVATRTKVRDLVPLLPGEGSVRGPLPAVASLTFAADGAWLVFRGPLAVQLWPMADVAVQQPAPGQEWVKFTTPDLGDHFFYWSLMPGSAKNTPRYVVRRAANGTVLDVRLTPCDLPSGCSENLPAIQLNVELPFEFTAVRGSFIEFSPSPNGADDCRGGTKHSSWYDTNASRSYWTLLAPEHAAEDLDCEHVGPKGDAGRGSLEECQQECFKVGVCNLVNYRTHPRNCDLRRCLDARIATLSPKRDNNAWALIRRSDLDELILPSHDGYVMFGAPDRTGRGGVVYGGCDAGPNVSRAGTKIVLPETVVSRTRTLRWQVAQSRSTETMGISNIELEVLRPVAERRFVAGPAASGAIALAPSQRELAAAGANGDLAVWDLKGFDMPTVRGIRRKLRSTFSFGLAADVLQDSDRARVVSTAAVTACGDPHSSVTTKALQGLGEGQRTLGNATYSLWDRVAVVEPGEYRICLCTGRSGVCCDADADFATQLQVFVAPGADSDHYVVCEAVATRTVKPECKIVGFKGVGLQAGDMIMLQDVANCGEATGPLAGFPNGGVMVSRATVRRDFSGHYPGGQWYRFEGPTPAPNSVLDPISVTPAQGLTARLCWCGKLEQCDPNRPADFRIDAGLITVVRIRTSVDKTCFIQGSCEIRLALADATPIAAGDLVMIKPGPVPSERLGCPGDPVSGLGPAQGGLSSRMRVSNGEGIFDLGQTHATADAYRICWCQATIRPCVEPHEFNFDIGTLNVVEAKYVWPACTINVSSFAGWRNWLTFDDCCCNFAEAGALGCHDTRTQTYHTCSTFPPR